MATHPSILAWEIPWAEEPGGRGFPAAPRQRPRESFFKVSPGKAGISGLHSRLPRGVRPRLEGKPRTPLSSRVATRVSWSPLSGLKGTPVPLLPWPYLYQEFPTISLFPLPSSEAESPSLNTYIDSISFIGLF